MANDPSGTMGSAALIVAHPGHELRLHRWLELARPTVCVITDGSGRTQRSRLASTTRVLQQAGARPGRVYGCCSDAELYAALLTGDIALVDGILRAIVDELVALDVDIVVADALEGFNPSHDLCRFIVNAAVVRVERETGRRLKNFDFLLDGNPEAGAAPSAVRVELSEADLARKLSVADGYPELRAEKDAALARYGTAPFRTELLRLVADHRQGLDGMPDEPPYYELFGEQQVRAGHYRDVIRYREHVLPIVHRLWSGAATGVANDVETSAALVRRRVAKAALGNRNREIRSRVG